MPLLALVRAVDQAFEAQRVVLGRRLDELDRALVHADPVVRERAREQVAVIRVGLICMAEAIDDLTGLLHHVRMGCVRDAHH